MFGFAIWSMHGPAWLLGHWRYLKALGQFGVLSRSRMRSKYFSVAKKRAKKIPHRFLCRHSSVACTNSHLQITLGHSEFPNVSTLWVFSLKLTMRSDNESYVCAGGIQVRLGLCHAQASALKGLVPTSNYSFGVLSIFAWMQTLVGRTCIITRLRRWSAKQRKHQKFGRRITWWAIFGVAYMLLWLTFHFTVMQLQMLWDAGPWMVQTLEGGLWPWAQKTKV